MGAKASMTASNMVLQRPLNTTTLSRPGTAQCFPRDR